MQVSSSDTLSLKPKIKNWIWPSSLVCIFLFFPTGIVGLIFAIMSRIKLKNDDIEGAEKAGKKARIWTIVSFWIGITLVVAEIIHRLITKRSLESYFS